MEKIPQADIEKRIARDNPWWAGEHSILEASWQRRVYFEPFKRLALDTSVRRAAVLLGPRRVGKTVMIKQLIAEAIAGDFKPQHILYASIDAPIYSGMSLESFLSFLPERMGSGDTALVVFDEIQYLRNWEVHLKDLVDNYANIKFVATGSAAAALRLKSTESGAGRFTDFLLPPLTFYEFLCFIEKDNECIEVRDKKYIAKDISVLNEHFVDYLNYGGYPEAVLNESVRKNQDQFIRNDIIDKVLLKDLPNLYGISDIQQLNRLFSFLAYNAGKEASFENISQESGIAKPTIKKYIEYLESAFLILKLSPVDDNCKPSLRERNFKIYLNNPSMRAALFTPVELSESEQIGYLAESAVFSQWQHAAAFKQLRYARWRNEGEVDVVYLAGTHPFWIGEIKWSDKPFSKFGEQTRSISHFLKRHGKIKSCFITTKTKSDVRLINNLSIGLVPTSLYCYTVGRNVTETLDSLFLPDRISIEPNLLEKEDED